MRKILLIAGLLTAFLVIVVIKTSTAQTPVAMKMNVGIITSKLEASKKFYTEILNFGITFENDFYLLMHTPNHSAEISFLLSNHPSQQPIFQTPFVGKGLYLTIEVPDVKKEYDRLKKLGVSMEVALREEPWGDTHFAIKDPNGIGIDIVTYSPKQ